MGCRLTAGASLLALSVLIAPLQAQAQDERFAIERFEIRGSSLLPAQRLQALVAPLTGPNRVYGDIQKALEAIEAAYRAAGYAAVQVYVPEQELTGGRVIIEVTESTIGQLTVSGNVFFSEANIRASLPALAPGTTPNLNALSQAIQLANDNPAKQIDVTLGSGAREGSIDAKVTVSDHRPQRLFVTLDNTGSAATGRYRIGASYQHANLFDRDHVATVSYTTAPDHPGGVDVALWSLGYRIPVYRLGDSIDLIYGRSSVNTPGVTPTLTGVLGIVGKGEVAGLRYNHILPRQGAMTSRIVAGIDYKYTDARCDVGGVPVSIDPPTPPIASCVPYTTRPVSLSYSFQRQAPARIWDASISAAHNLPTGSRFTNLDGRIDRYSYLTPGNRSSIDRFTVLRATSALQQGIGGRNSDWQLRLAGTAQASRHALVAGEQIGLAGAGAVRGFAERAVAADAGLVVNAELIGPELAKALAIGGNLRLLGFVDVAHGRNHRATGSSVFADTTIASTGAGLRYGLGRDASVRLDVARVAKAGAAAASGTGSGDWKMHLSMMLGF